MIVRRHDEAWQVVLQTDHADLSGAVAEVWTDRGPRHDSVVVAARRHDDGWAVWERSPLVGADGAPVGFLDVHVPAHLAFYRAGIAAVTDEDPYAGLLVSMHGAGIYQQRYGADPSLSLSRAAEVQPLVDAFVAEQESAHPARAAAVGVDDELRWADYHRLQWFDRFSLAFCLREWDHPDDSSFELGSFQGRSLSVRGDLGALHAGAPARTEAALGAGRVPAGVLRDRARSRRARALRLTPLLSPRGSQPPARASRRPSRARAGTRRTRSAGRRPRRGCSGSRSALSRAPRKRGGSGTGRSGRRGRD